jgi:hypothetical protein
VARDDNMDTLSCITNLQWERYSNKTLDEPDIHYLQEHVMVCEVCADIKEGIDAMLVPAMLAERVEAINMEVDEYLKNKGNNKSHLWFWSIAAMVVLGIGISWLMMNNKKVIVADNHSKQFILNDSDLAKSKLQPQFKSDPKSSNELKTSDNTYKIKEEQHSPGSAKTPLESSNATIAPPVEDQKNEVAKKDADQYYAVNEDAARRQLDTVVQPVVVNKYTEMEDNDKQVSFSKSLSTRNSNGNPTPQTASVPSKALEKESNAKASKSIRKGEVYPSAANNSGYDFSNNPNNNAGTSAPVVNLNAIDSADYGIAMHNFDSAYYDKCLVKLYYITMNPNSNYYEDGLLLKAKALLKLNKKEDAKVALNTVILLNKQRRKEATEMLDALNK